MFKNCKDCVLNNKIILKSQQRFKRDCHNVYIEEINKITLSSHDDKRSQICDKTTKYPHGTIAFKVWESKMLMITKMDNLITKSKDERDLKVIVKICVLNRSVRLHHTVTMMGDSK